jgi:hypothetical protein
MCTARYNDQLLKSYYFFLFFGVGMESLCSVRTNIWRSFKHAKGMKFSLAESIIVL